MASAAVAAINTTRIGNHLRTDRFRPLVDEADYAAFLAGLNLRYITAPEVIRPHRNVRNGVANRLPPKLLWRNLSKPLRVVDEICTRAGYRIELINSAFRTPAYNAECVGAAKRSYHLRNMAIDVRFNAAPLEVAKVAKALRSEGVFKGGIGVYPSFIHLDTRGRKADWGIS